MEFNKDEGFIKLYRSWFKEWEFNKDPLITYFFIYCLLTANHKPKYEKGVRYKAGQFIRSERQMAEGSGLNRNTIRRIIKELIDAGLITREKKDKSYLYTIKDYKKIIGLNLDQSVDQYPTNTQPIPTLNKNEKNVEEVDAEASPDYTDSFLNFWDAYGRKGYKKDTFEYWESQGYDDETIEKIVYGAKEYAEEHKDNKTRMFFPRTFLQNDIWENYEMPRERTSEEYQEYVKDLIGNLTTDAE